VRITRWVVACALAAIAISGTAIAQTVTGEIRGTVRDSSGGVLPGVTVTAINVNTGLKRSEVTNAAGGYVFPSLPLGPYTISAELEGFNRTERSGFDLVAGGRLTWHRRAGGDRHRRGRAG
jgi:hypothetical protein